MAAPDSWLPYDDFSRTWVTRAFGPPDTDNDLLLVLIPEDVDIGTAYGVQRKRTGYIMSFLCESKDYCLLYLFYTPEHLIMLSGSDASSPATQEGNFLTYVTAPSHQRCKANQLTANSAAAEGGFIRYIHSLVLLQWEPSIL